MTQRQIAYCFAFFALGLAIGWTPSGLSRKSSAATTSSESTSRASSSVAGVLESAHNPRVWVVRQDTSTDILVMSHDEKSPDIRSQVRVSGHFVAVINNGNKLVRVFFDCVPEK